LKEAIRKISSEEIETTGASRTDSGTHALGQVCHFDTSVGIPIGDWPRALNRVLPEDVSVLKARTVPTAFHARQSALGRHYRYRILLGSRDPLRMRAALHYGRPVDLVAMQRCAEALVGENDFRAFSEEVPVDATTFRRLDSVDLKIIGDELRINIKGNAFLRGMMRRIAGGLLEVGRGHRSESDFCRLLDPEQRNSIQWPVVLPAKGLTLVRVIYGRKLGDNRIHSDTKDRTNIIDLESTEE